MLHAIKPSTGGYVLASVNGTDLHLDIRGDDAFKFVSGTMSYADVESANNGLAELHGLCEHYGLQVVQYARAEG